MELTKTKYKQTEVGLIPEDWDYNTISSVTPINNKYGIVDGPFGSNLKTIHYKTKGVPIITSGYVTDGEFYAQQYLYVTKEKFEQEKRSAVRPGDIVMAKIGARCGASAILPLEHPIGILSGNALKITVDNNRHNTYFIWQQLWGLYINNKIEGLKSIGAQPAISMPSLKNFKIPLPPLPEQKAIAEVLSDVDRLIQVTEQKLAKKRAIKQGAMQKLLTPKEDWEVKKLGEIGDIVTGSTPSTFVQEYWNGDIPWITPTDISSNLKNISNSEREITPSGLMATRKLPANTLLVTCIASIGKNAVLRKVGACNQQINAIIPFETNNVDFLYYLIEANKKLLLSKAGITATLMVSKKTFSQIEFSIPSFEEQSRIATILSDMDKEIELIEQQIAKYKTLKQGLMQELLTGKTRLTV